MGDAGRLPKRELGLYAGSWVAASSSSSPEISLAVRGRKVLEEGWEVERAVVALVVVLLIAKGKLDFAADASQRRLLYLSASDQPSQCSLFVGLSVCRRDALSWRVGGGAMEASRRCQWRRCMCDRKVGFHIRHSDSLTLRLLVQVRFQLQGSVVVEL